MRSIDSPRKPGATTARLLGLVTAAALLMTGCGSFGTLERVSKGDHAATDIELQEVQVIRDGGTLTTARNMPIKKGDKIRTGPDVQAVLELEAGYEVYLEADTELEILNPSLLLILGKAFVQKVKEVREALKVNTEYEVVTPKTTRFLVSVDPDSVVTVTVLEGEVELASRADSWAPLYVRNAQQAVIRRRQPPEPIRTVEPREIDPLVAWVERVDRVTTRVVPDLSEEPLEEARATLEGMDLSAGRVRYQITGAAQPGRVFRQDPLPGARVPVGSVVDLWVEKESVLVPNVGGVPQEEARRRLEEERLRVGQVQQVLTDQHRDGVVMKQSPRAGKRVEVGTAVKLDVAEAGVRLPDLRRLSLDEARGSLRQFGLEVGPPTMTPTNRYQAGTIIKQTPSPGTLVRRGTSVQLEVAQAIIERTAQRCVVPDLIGRSLTQEEARQILEQAGLELGRVMVLEARQDTVTAQEPTVRSVVPCGTAVALTFGVIG